MNAFRVRHLENALNRFDELAASHLPIDIFAKKYFQQHKRISSADKLWIRGHIYELIRWKALLDYVSPPPPTWTSRLRTFLISDRWRAHTRNKRLPPALRCSFPENLFKRIEASLGASKAVDVCNILNETPLTFLRVNTSKISRDRLLKFLINKGVMVEKCTNSPIGLILGQLVKLNDLAEFTKGYIEIQDESSQLVGCKVEAKPGDKVLDYCSGSGGKTVVFGPRMQGSGRIYLHDIRTRILKQAKRRLKNANITNYTLVLPNDPILERLRGSMDWVLTDVPCTGTGSLRKNPDMKWIYSDDWLKEKIECQRSIVEKALQYLKPKGKLVYSTSSVLDEENSFQIQYFCETHKLMLSEEPFHSLPQSKGMDGFFCATLERC